MLESLLLQEVQPDLGNVEAYQLNKDLEMRIYFPGWNSDNSPIIMVQGPYGYSDAGYEKIKKNIQELNIPDIVKDTALFNLKTHKKLSRAWIDFIASPEGQAALDHHDIEMDGNHFLPQEPLQRLVVVNHSDGYLGDAGGFTIPGTDFTAYNSYGSLALERNLKRDYGIEKNFARIFLINLHETLHHYVKPEELKLLDKNNPAYTSKLEANNDMRVAQRLGIASQYCENSHKKDQLIRVAAASLDRYIMNEGAYYRLSGMQDPLGDNDRDGSMAHLQQGIRGYISYLRSKNIDEKTIMMIQKHSKHFNAINSYAPTQTQETVQQKPTVILMPVISQSQTMH